MVVNFSELARLEVKGDVKVAEAGRVYKTRDIGKAVAAADYIGDLDMGFGRLDTYQSLLACRILH